MTDLWRIRECTTDYIQVYLTDKIRMYKKCADCHLCTFFAKNIDKDDWLWYNDYIKKQYAFDGRIRKGRENMYG